MAAWTFRNTAPWRGVFDWTITGNDFRNWSHQLGMWGGPGFPFNCGEVIGGYWSVIQGGGGEGGTTDYWHWTPATWVESPTCPAQWRGFIKAWISPDDNAQDSPNLDRARTPVVAPVWDLARLPDGGKYALGFIPVHNEAERANLINPDLLRNDPNYGTITFAVNAKHPPELADKIAGIMQMVVVAGFTAGFASLGFPALALTAIKDASKGDIQAFLNLGVPFVDTFDFSDGGLADLLDSTDTTDVSDFVNNDPGYLDGGIDPGNVDDFANADTSFPEGFDSQGNPDEGTIDDNPDATDNNSNPYTPDQQPGMPYAPTPPRKAGTNPAANTRPTSSGAAAGKNNGFGGIFDQIFGSSKGGLHSAPGYPAGKQSLPNPYPITGNRPLGSSAANPGGIAAMFASPTVIAVGVVAILAVMMTK